MRARTATASRDLRADDKARPSGAPTFTARSRSGAPLLVSGTLGLGAVLLSRALDLSTGSSEPASLLQLSPRALKCAPRPPAEVVEAPKTALSRARRWAAAIMHVATCTGHLGGYIDLVRSRWLRRATCAHVAKSGLGRGLWPPTDGRERPEPAPFGSPSHATYHQTCLPQHGAPIHVSDPSSVCARAALKMGMRGLVISSSKDHATHAQIACLDASVQVSRLVRRPGPCWLPSADHMVHFGSSVALSACLAEAGLMWPQRLSAGRSDRMSTCQMALKTEI